MPPNRSGAYFRMRRNLSEPIAPAPLVAGYAFVPFGPTNGPACRSLMNAVYGQGFGDEMAFDAWWPWLTRDPEFDPALMQVVASGRAVVGVCHAWSGGFIKDIVVAPAHRGRGVGAAMLTRTLEALKAIGHQSVDLKVDVDNLGAQALYGRLGFTIVERLDRT